MGRFAVDVGAIVVVIGGMSTPVIAQPPPLPWNQCCGTTPWPMGRGMMGPSMMGSMPRHHAAMMSGVPAPYNALSNPLPRAKATVDRGAKVYAANCSSCHGATGQGDGKAGQRLSPPPGNLASLSQMPMAGWDPFMYWTVAEGGSAFGTAMWL
jgi:mono/diheme cytochrome c family protein